MEIEKNNNKELVPLEHYLEEYAKADPAEISRRTGMPYDAEKHQFTVRFLDAATRWDIRNLPYSG